MNYIISFLHHMSLINYYVIFVSVSTRLALQKHENTAVRNCHADHVALSIHKSWH
jgi:hypothetical protein